MIREPIGEIECPLCGRLAELHSSDSRPKVAPDAEGRAAYPRKLFVVCPPVPGYRGCGTLLCNNQHAQQRLIERGRVFGRPPLTQEPAAAKPEPKSEPRQEPAVAPPAAPEKSAKPAGSRSLFRPFSS